MPRRKLPEAAGEHIFVSYLRVSTQQQGASGLGIEAQRAAVAAHAARTGGVIAAEFAEVESGKRNDRPQLAAALQLCAKKRAVLVIAKLDRLARNANFLLGLRDAGVEFVACDMPDANRLTVGIMALVAEDERERGSARTKAALAAAKARGTKLGNPRLLAGDRTAGIAAAAARRTLALARARSVMPAIEGARKAGCRTLAQLATALGARGIKTPAGRPTWSAEQVRRVILTAGQET